MMKMNEPKIVMDEATEVTPKQLEMLAQLKQPDVPVIQCPPVADIWRSKIEDLGGDIQTRK